MSSYNYGPEGPRLYSKGKFAPATLWVFLLGGVLLCLVIGFYESVIYFITDIMSFVVIVVGAWSHQRYNRLQLFENEFRVGRNSIAINELDPELPVRRASDVFSEDQLLTLES